MPRYYFHVFDGRDEIDTDGTVLEHAEEARRQAVIYASELLGSRPHAAPTCEAWRMDVNGDGGAPIFRLDFSITDTSPKEAFGEAV